MDEVQRGRAGCDVPAKQNRNKPGIQTAWHFGLAWCDPAPSIKSLPFPWGWHSLFLSQLSPYSSFLQTLTSLFLHHLPFFIMKLPSSSSILFATLAISSSSSSLAAPTAPGDTSLTTSSSNHHSAFHRAPNVGHKSRGIHSPGKNFKRRPDGIVERRLAYRKLSLVPCGTIWTRNWRRTI